MSRKNQLIRELFLSGEGWDVGVLRKSVLCRRLGDVTSRTRVLIGNELGLTTEAFGKLRVLRFGRGETTNFKRRGPRGFDRSSRK